MKKLLHVGCGFKTIAQTTEGFLESEWIETRYDIDDAVAPDVVGSMLNMSQLKDESFDAIFSSHNIEHLFATEVPVALSEFLRVLNRKGFALITCPDLQSVCRYVVDDQLVEPLYQSQIGPISALDILYGHRSSIAEGNIHMAHRCGFTEQILVNTTRSAGFNGIISAKRAEPYFDLWMLASKGARSERELRELALAHFPKI